MNRTASSAIFACALAAATLAFPRASQAQEEIAESPDLGPDEVELKNGGVLRGTIVSLEPGEEVVIQVHGRAEPRVLAWSEVADVQRDKHVKAAVRAEEEKPQSETPKPVEERVEGPGVVRLRIVADEPGVELHEVVGISTGVSQNGVFVVGHTRSVCTAPCDKVIDARDGRRFFFAGDGVPASDAFSLADRQGDVTARVDAGSTGLGIGGWFMSVLGVTGVVGGAIFTGVAYGLDDPSEFFESWRVAGPVTLGVGAALLGGGIAMMVLAGTDYQLNESAPSASGTNRKLQARSPRWWLGEF